MQMWYFIINLQGKNNTLKIFRKCVTLCAVHKTNHGKNIYLLKWWKKVSLEWEWAIKGWANIDGLVEKKKKNRYRQHKTEKIKIIEIINEHKMASFVRAELTWISVYWAVHLKRINFQWSISVEQLNLFPLLVFVWIWQPYCLLKVQNSWQLFNCKLYILQAD